MLFLLTLSWRRLFSCRNLSANQWTGFYMITASVMKGLNYKLSWRLSTINLWDHIFFCQWHTFIITCFMSSINSFIDKIYLLFFTIYCFSTLVCVNLVGKILVMLGYFDLRLTYIDAIAWSVQLFMCFWPLLCWLEHFNLPTCRLIWPCVNFQHLHIRNILWFQYFF